SEERMRRFIADAGHELRTPLTAIRGFAEYYRQRGGMETRWDHAETPATGGGLTPSDLDRLMQRVEKEAARMGLLVEDLLQRARPGHRERPRLRARRRGLGADRTGQGGDVPDRAAARPGGARQRGRGRRSRPGRSRRGPGPGSGSGSGSGRGRGGWHRGPGG